MKYTKRKEQLEIGRKIYYSGLTNLKAAEQFGISEESARRYRLLYKKSLGIEHRPYDRRIITDPAEAGTSVSSKGKYPAEYASMSKEELIEELMQTKIREARLKKGYMVKGVGADKEYILLDSKNTK